MKAYELMLMLSPALDDESRAATLEKVQGVISGSGGAVDKVDEWGKRKLAFEIGKITEGDYAIIDFHAAPDSIAELDRVLRITDPVVRFMVVHREDRD